MEHTAPFKRFMQDLVSDLGRPQQRSRSPVDKPDIHAGREVNDAGRRPTASYTVEITEENGGDVLFSVKLGIAASDLQHAAVQVALHHNMPRAGEPGGTIGLHPAGIELCLWRRESLDVLSPQRTAMLVKQLVLQTAELGNRLAQCL